MGVVFIDHFEEMRTRDLKKSTHFGGPVRRWRARCLHHKTQI